MWCRLLMLIVLACPITAAADVSPEQLRDMAYASDVAAVEAAFVAADAAQRAGHIDLAAIRDMHAVLNTSHPDLIHFQVRWLARFPKSPYALTLRADALMAAAWRRRGGLTAFDTHPEALEDFNRASTAALDLVRLALAVAPDYLPTIDSALSLQQVTRSMTDEETFALTRHAMELTPNLATLQNGLSGAQEKWGGAGMSEVARYCTAFADMIPTEPGFDVAVCIARIIGWQGRTGPAYEVARQVAVETGHVNLGGLRRQAALERRSPADRALLLEYLSRPGTTDWRKGQRFDEAFNPSVEEAAILRGIDRRAMARARDWLPHDPLDTNTIQYLLNVLWSAQPEAGTHPFQTEARHLVLLKRMAVAQPFDPQGWFDAGRFILVATGDFVRAYPYFENAIYYSRHDAFFLRQVLELRLQFLQIDDWIVAGAGQPPNPITLPILRDAAQICPVVRLARLIAETCTEKGDTACLETLQVFPAAQVYTAIKTHDLCRQERFATLDDLWFRPVSIAQADIMDGIANRGGEKDPGGFTLAP